MRTVTSALRQKNEKKNCQGAAWADVESPVTDWLKCHDALPTKCGGPHVLYGVPDLCVPYSSVARGGSRPFSRLFFSFQTIALDVKFQGALV